MNIQGLSGLNASTYPTLSAPASGPQQPVAQNNFPAQGSDQKVPVATGGTTSTSSTRDSTSATEVDAQSKLTTKADKKQLEEAAKVTENFVHSALNSALQFKYDDDAGEMVVKVIDTSTDQVLRQIPSEEMLQIAKALGKLQGILVKSSA